MVHINAESIERSLAFLKEERHYRVEIHIRLGVTAEVVIDPKHLKLPSKLQAKIEQPTEGRIRPMRQRVFQELLTAERQLIEIRRQIYFKHTEPFASARWVGGSKLSDYLSAVSESLEPAAAQMKTEIIKAHPIALQRWIEGDVIPRLEAAGYKGQELDQLIHLYQARFPSLSRIVRDFRIELETDEKKSVSQILKENAEAQHAVLQLEAQRLEREKLLIEERELNARIEAQRYEERRIKKEIDEKLSEVGNQVLTVVLRNLRKIADKGWNAQSLSQKVKTDLNSLIRSCKELQSLDTSFGELSDSLTNISQGSVIDPNFDLQNEVKSLLSNLEKQVSSIEQQQEEQLNLIAELRDDRANYIQFSVG